MCIRDRYGGVSRRRLHHTFLWSPASCARCKYVRPIQTACGAVRVRNTDARMICHGTIRYSTTLPTNADTCVSAERTQVSANVRIHCIVHGYGHLRTLAYTRGLCGRLWTVAAKVRNCPRYSRHVKFLRTAVAEPRGARVMYVMLSKV